MSVAGAANGTFGLGGALREGHAAATAAANDLGFTANAGKAATASDETVAIQAFWHVKESRGRAWVDYQNDVTTKDIVQSHSEGFRSGFFNASANLNTAVPIPPTIKSDSVDHFELGLILRSEQ